MEYPRNRGFLPIIVAVSTAVVLSVVATYVVFTESNMQVEETKTPPVVDESTMKEVDEVVISTATTSEETEDESPSVDTNVLVTPKITTSQKSAPQEIEKVVVPQIQPTTEQKKLEDFTLSCNPESDTVSVGEDFEIDLKLEGDARNYKIEWDDRYLIVGNNTKTGTFSVGSIDNASKKKIEIWVQATRKEDGLNQTASCSILVKKDETNTTIEPTWPEVEVAWSSEPDTTHFEDRHKIQINVTGVWDKASLKVQYENTDYYPVNGGKNPNQGGMDSTMTNMEAGTYHWYVDATRGGYDKSFKGQFTVE